MKALKARLKSRFRFPTSLKVNSSVIKQQRIFNNLPEADIRSFFSEVVETDGNISKDNFVKLLNAFYIGFVFDVHLSSVPKSDLTNALENLKFIFEKRVNQDKGQSIAVALMCEGGVIRDSQQQPSEQDRVDSIAGPIQRSVSRHSGL